MEEDLIIAKTAAAEVEIKTRALRLAPRLRSTLILVDGKRSVAETTALLGDAAAPALQQLLDLGLIAVIGRASSRRPVATAAVASPGSVPGYGSAVAPPAQSPASPASASAATDGDIAGDLLRLPDAATRSAKEIEMSRQFMINTVNMIFGQNTRLSLVRSIFECGSAEALRAVYPRWFCAMAENRNGAKRLAEFRSKLAATL